MTPPFSLRIFVADGDPDGLCIVNWMGRALMFLHPLLSSTKVRLYLAQPEV